MADSAQTIDPSTTAVLAAPSAESIAESVWVGHDLSVSRASFEPVTSDRRMSALRAIIGASDAVDAVFVTNLDNIRALTGFTGSAGRLLVDPDHAWLITDARYEERAADELRHAASDASVVIRRSVAEQNGWLVEELRTQRIAKLGLEAGSVTWAAQRQLAELVDELGVELAPVNGLVERLRRTKSAAEVLRTARAAAIADRALEDVLPVLAQGPTERAFQRALDDAMLAHGADAISFDTIIASGPNGSRPHHEPGDRVIVEGDAVICDFGALIDGYHSDMTRTIFVGEPSKAQMRHFDAVRRAHDNASAAIAAGVACTELHAVAQAACDEAGWGEFFTHGLGHGTGLVIHELPWLGPTSANAIADGDLVTIEPGIYLPGAAGVRIENLYAVTTAGAIALTKAPVDIVVG
jgi:Xaa-Pro aminopeptidase